MLQNLSRRLAQALSYCPGELIHIKAQAGAYDILRYMNTEDQKKIIHKAGNAGFAFFLVLAGLIMLAQQFGWIPRNLDWLFPILLIIWGASELYLRYRW
jgi:hypothetical protein